MKQTYFSLVIPLPTGSDDEFTDRLTQCLELDALLDACVRMHEIVFVSRGMSQGQQRLWDSRVRAADLTGPVSIVGVSDARATHEQAMIEGLSRSVGDLVLEWEAEVAALDAGTLQELFDLSDEGQEVVSIVPAAHRLGSRAFYSVINRYRTVGQPLHAEIGRLMSRAAVDRVLDSQHAVRHRKVIIAQGGFSTADYSSQTKSADSRSYVSRLEEAMDVTLTATRLGTRLTYVLALLAAVGGLAAALYAVFVAIFRGGTPEGWLTLMVVVGLGFAATLLVLALLGEMLSRIFSEVRRSSQDNVTVQVVAPTQHPSV